MTEVVLHHDLSGPATGPPLVLGNSLGTTLDMWRPQLPTLTDRWRVLRYDHRGHGASPAPPGPYDVAALGSDVLALLDRLGIERTAYCGVSLGAMVGMWLAAHAPERIDTLVLICTSAYLPPASMWAQRAAAVRAAGTTEAVADTVLARWLTPAFARDHAELVAWLRTMFVSAPAEGYAACCEVVERLDLRPVLPAIVAPTLVIAGEHDEATPVEHARTIAGAVPAARLEVVPAAAHLASVERPPAVTRLIVDHLEPQENR
jgi:3-oxoadipate enol-lactonase